VEETGATDATDATDELAEDHTQPHPDHVDPITLEVVRNALVGIAEEAGAALRRTAYSPNIKERIDCSTAVFDAEGRMVAQAEHIPVHLGSMPLSVAAARAAFDALEPGDQVLVSDPYAGGTHLPDWTLVAPIVDADGALLGFAANRAHHSDVGGSAPGSMPAGARDIFAEGLRIPPVKLYVAGEESRDLVAMLLANTRTPRERLGDMRAQVGANQLTATRLRALAADLGVEGLQAAMTATLGHAERAMRAAIRELPDGTYHFEDVLDGDGTGVGPIPIRVALTIDDGTVHADLRGSSPQVPGSVNAPYAVTLSAAVYALRAVAAPDLPANDGIRRVLQVTTDPGSVVDASPPASVAAANVETSQRIVDVLLGAFAQAAPERVGAASQGTMNNTLFGGTDPRTGEAFTYYETLGGGMGAGPWGPGASGIQSHMTNTKNTPIEAFELAYPLRVVEYRLRDGSGGEGEHRGGEGLRRVLQVLTDDATASLLPERRDHAPWGAHGGGDGARGRNAVRRAGSDTDDELPAKISLALHRDDRLIVETPGGGGYGAARAGGG
jgi:N-methylhydantoinase B